MFRYPIVCVVHNRILKSFFCFLVVVKFKNIYSDAIVIANAEIAFIYNFLGNWFCPFFYCVYTIIFGLPPRK